MSMNILILIAVVAIVAYFIWKPRGKSDSGAGAMTSGAAGTAAAGAAGPVASYEDYRRTSPSNMINGKLTCNRCGSNMIATAGSTASCSNCGAALYRT